MEATELIQWDVGAIVVGSGDVGVKLYHERRDERLHEVESRNERSSVPTRGSLSTVCLNSQRWRGQPKVSCRGWARVAVVGHVIVVHRFTARASMRAPWVGGEGHRWVSANNSHIDTKISQDIYTES